MKKHTKLFVIIFSFLFVSLPIAQLTHAVSGEIVLADKNQDREGVQNVSAGNKTNSVSSSAGDERTQSKVQKNKSVASSGDTEGRSQYIIGVGDVLKISVWRNPDLSVTVPVRPDGMISTPLVDDIKAAGLIPEVLAAAIGIRLNEYIRDPHVTVIVTSVKSDEFKSRVRITGAVRSPSSIAYREGMTVLDVILNSGGVNEFAAPNRTKLYRKTGSGTKIFKIKLKDILNKGKLETNYTLKPGDIITVPERYL